jgi:hypothetical protein
MGIKMIGQNKITDFVDCILFMLYYPSNCEFESHSRRVHSIQHYVIKFLSDLSLRQVGGFLRVLRFPPPIKLTATI